LLVIVAAGGCGGGSLRNANKPVAPDRRMAVLEAVRVKFGSLTGTDTAAQNQEMASFMRAMPEFEASGVSDDGCAWARFTDGRLLIVANNRRPEPVRSFPVAELTTRASGLPEQTLVHLYDTMGTSFTHPAVAFRGTLIGHGYQIAGDAIKNGTVEEMKAVGGTGVFYMDAHGGSAQTRNFSWLFAIWTGTRVSSSLETAYADDLDNNRLAYMVALGDGANETHYAATGFFVNQYMRFGPNSLVFINACSSYDPSFRQACLAAGAGVYLGWTQPVADNSAYGAAVFMFDRLLGNNSVAPTDNPAKPPMTWNELLSAMSATTYAVTGTPFDTSVGSTTAFLRAAAGQGDLGPITPSIRELDVDTTAMTATLKGHFGSVTGTVDENGSIGVPGAPLKVLSWTATQIVCEIGDTTKSVIVRAGGRPSNIGRLPGTNYILSGATGGPFGVDDNLRVWVGNQLIYEDVRGAYAGNRGPFTFRATKGDNLRIEVQDWYGQYAGYESIYITTPAGDTTLLEQGRFIETPPGSQAVVLDKTYTLP
jgi:hypothetical protein